MWHLYILRCQNGSLYIGTTKNVSKRFHDHKNAKGGKYTRSNKPVKIIYEEKFQTRSEALKREIELKKWPKAKKEALVKGNLVLLKKLQNKINRC